MNHPPEDLTLTQFPNVEPPQGSSCRSTDSDSLSATLHRVVSEFIDPRIEEITSVLRSLEREILLTESKRSQPIQTLSGQPLDLQDNDGLLDDLKNEVESLRRKNDQLEQLLTNERSRRHCLDLQVSELNSEIEHLRKQLSNSATRITEYELQVDELSRKVTRLKGPESIELLQTMTWEERKRILLNQLEHEANTASKDRFSELLDIDRIISETSELLQNKEAEIQGLIKLIEEQAIVHDTFAVGATAVSAILDNDALVVAERQKLRELQSEWEEQQRQLEIEISMERAKLARDQLELQQRLAELRQVYPESYDDRSAHPSAMKKSRRQGRWLSQLGLCDE